MSILDIIVGRYKKPVGLDDIVRKGENIVNIAHIHWGIYWRGLALLLLSIYLFLNAFNLGTFILFVAVVNLIFARLTKHYLMLALTDKRVIIRHGILNLDTTQIPLDKIESIDIERPIIGRILGYGVVFVSGVGTRKIRVPYIDNFSKFRNDFDDLVHGEDEE